MQEQGQVECVAPDVLDGGDEALALERHDRAGVDARGRSRAEGRRCWRSSATPPSSSGTPRSATFTRSLRAAGRRGAQADRHETVRARLGGRRRCRWIGAWNGTAGSGASTWARRGDRPWSRRRGPRAGAPAFRLGEPSPTASGPPGAQTAIATGSASATTAAGHAHRRRAFARLDHPPQDREHDRRRPSRSRAGRTSRPARRCPCRARARARPAMRRRRASARARQARRPIRARSRLVTISASSRSNATAPKPEPDRAVARGERDDRVAKPDRRVAVEHRRQHVHDDERERQQASRCGAARRRRSAASAAPRQRVELRMPSTSPPVSRSSATTPVPRVRYQRRSGRVAASESRGAPPASRRCSTTSPEARARAAPASSAPSSQAGASSPSTTRRGARDVRVHAGAVGDADRPPRRHGRAAGARVDDVVELDRAGAPAAHGRAGGREAAGADATVGPGSSSAAAWSSATRIGQPPSGARPGDGDVAAEADEHAAARRPRPAARALRSAASALAVAPRSSSTPGGERDVRGARSSSICRQPGTGAKRARNERPVAERDGREACGRSRRAGACGRPSGRRGRRSTAAARERHLERLEQARADRAPPRARGGVQADELGVVAEAAAGAVDLGELPLERCVRSRKRRPATMTQSSAVVPSAGNETDASSAITTPPETATGGAAGHGWRAGARRCGRRRRRGRSDGTSGGGRCAGVVRRPALSWQRAAGPCARDRVRREAGEGAGERRGADDREARRAPQARQAVVARRARAARMEARCMDQRAAAEMRRR